MPRNIIMSGAAANEYKPPHPDRTARRNVGHGPMDFDVEFKEWPSRESMMKVIRQQEQREHRRNDWAPVKKEAPSMAASAEQGQGGGEERQYRLKWHHRWREGQQR